MKRTKSMRYQQTIESNELFLYATNDGDLYRKMITPVINNLRKKAIKGEYDSEKAIDAYYYVACEASKMYNKDFGYSFSVADRFTAAVDMERYYKEDHVFYDIDNKSMKTSLLNKLHEKQDNVKSNEGSIRNNDIEKETRISER